MKKSTQKKYKVLALIVVALIIAAGIGYFSVSKLLTNSQKDDIKTRINEVVGGLRTNNFVKYKSVKDTLTYTLPSGWTKEEDPSTDETVTLESEDYNRNMLKGAEISISVLPKDLFLTLDEIKRDIKKDNDSTFTDIKIDNVPGIKVIEIKDRYENYCFIKGEYLISIETLILPQDISEEMKNGYWKDINSIIDSIQFK